MAITMGRPGLRSPRPIAANSRELLLDEDRVKTMKMIRSTRETSISGIMLISTIGAARWDFRSLVWIRLHYVPLTIKL